MRRRRRLSKTLLDRNAINFRPISNIMELVARLQVECAVKEDNQVKRMGFIA